MANGAVDLERTPVVTIGAYPRLLRVGEGVSIPIAIRRPPNGARIVQVQPDLTGDGLAGWPVGWGEALSRALAPWEGRLLHENTIGLESLTGVMIYPRRAGVFNLDLSATSEEGCVGRTRLARTVTVTP